MVHYMLVPDFLKHRARSRSWLVLLTHSNFSNDAEDLDVDRSGLRPKDLVLWAHIGTCQASERNESYELSPP